MKVLLILAIVAAAAYGIGCFRGNGSVTVPGWEHAYAYCDTVIVIDPGHHRDPEVTQFFKLIDEKCAK